MNLDSSIAFIATLVASGMQSIDMFFFAEEGNASTVAVMNLSWVMGTKLALPAGGHVLTGLENERVLPKTLPLRGYSLTTIME